MKSFERDNNTRLVDLVCGGNDAELVKDERGKPVPTANGKSNKMRCKPKAKINDLYSLEVTSRWV